MTWTREKSSAGLRFCFFQVNGFNSTMMRLFGLLSEDYLSARCREVGCPMMSTRSGLRLKGGPGVRYRKGCSHGY